MLAEYNRSATFQHLYMSMVCCAFIPSDKIQEVWESVVATEFDDVSDQLSEDAIGYFDYFETTYIGRQVRGRRQTPRIHPNKWSQFQSILSGISRPEVQRPFFVLKAELFFLFSSKVRSLLQCEV